MSCGIYKITNPKGRIYIGLSKNIEGRWKSYKKLQCESQPLLFRSLKKYGVDQHIFEIIELCESDKLLERETFWKVEFDVLNIPSLCCRIDGPNGMLSELTRRNLSEASKGKTFKHKSPKSKEGLVKLSTEEYRAIQPNCRPVLQFDSNENFIKEWPSISSVQRTLNLNIYDVLSGRLKTCGGFIWKYKNPNLKYKSKFSVGQYNLNDELINIFNSISDASKHLNLDYGSIVTVCNNKLYSTGGFKWKKIETISPEMRQFVIDLPTLESPQRKVYQFDLKGNFIDEFSNASIAAKNNNLSVVGIQACCNKKQYASGEFIWKYDNFPFDIVPKWKSKKSVLQFDLNGNFISEFESAADARRETKTESIYECLAGKMPNW